MYLDENGVLGNLHFTECGTMTLAHISHLTNTGHPGHSGLAGVSSWFHVPLSKEEIEFVIIPDRAVDALSQKR